MSVFRCAAAAALLSLTLAVRGAAQGTITLSGEPGTLAVRTAVAGAPPDAMRDGSTTYSLLDVAGTSRITARLDAPLPSGVTLSATLGAPSGATTLGAVALTTTEQDVVVQIPAGTHSGLSITYELRATTAAGTLPSTGVAVSLALRTDP